MNIGTRNFKYKGDRKWKINVKIITSIRSVNNVDLQKKNVKIIRRKKMSKADDMFKELGYKFGHTEWGWLE